MSHLISSEKMKLIVRITVTAFSLDYAGVRFGVPSVPEFESIVVRAQSLLRLEVDTLRSYSEILDEILVSSQVRRLTPTEVKNILHNQIADWHRVMNQFRTDVDDYFRKTGE